MDRELELALVARLRVGDATAFDAVHDLFNAPLFAFLVRLTRRRDLAEDLLEETWLRFVARAAALSGDTRLGPWLFTVARNLYLSYCRSRLVEDTHASSLIGLWPAGSATPSPFESTATKETLRCLETALVTLPLPYREALLLVGVEGLRPADAAAVCGITAEAMRQRLARARTLLARRLGEAGVTGLARLREVTA